MPNLILIAKAVEESSYSADHIGLLLRQGKVKGEKIGGTWLVDLDNLLEYEERMAQLGTKKHSPGRKSST